MNSLRVPLLSYHWLGNLQETSFHFIKVGMKNFTRRNEFYGGMLNCCIYPFSISGRRTDNLGRASRSDDGVYLRMLGQRLRAFKATLHHNFQPGLVRESRRTNSGEGHDVRLFICPSNSDLHSTKLSHLPTIDMCVFPWAHCCPPNCQHRLPCRETQPKSNPEYKTKPDQTQSKPSNTHDK